MNVVSLERLAPLLSVLREFATLVEVRPTVFHLANRDFLHFHDEPDGLVADVRLTRGRVRIPVASRAQQAELLARIEEVLIALERPYVEKGRRGRHHHRGDGDW